MSTTINLTQPTEPVTVTVSQAGQKGEAGADGAPGPNEVTTSTTTDLTGLLTGDGSSVGVTLTSTGGNGATDGGKVLLFGSDGQVSAKTSSSSYLDAGVTGEAGGVSTAGVIGKSGDSGSYGVFGRAASGSSAIAVFGAAEAASDIALAATTTNTGATLIQLVDTTNGSILKINSDKSVQIESVTASNFLAELGGAESSHTHTATDLDFAGSTDIGAALADADEVLVSDGGGNTTRRKSALSRFWTYIKAKIDAGQTWAGAHIFSGAVTLNEGVSVSGTTSLTATAIAGREAVLRCKVSDVSTDTMLLGNGTSGANRFSPRFAGYVDSYNTAYSLSFWGMTDAANDASDSSGFGLVHFAAMRTSSSSDPTNGTLSAIQNRKLYTFGDHSTGIYMTIAASGNVGIGEATPDSKLTVAGDIEATGAANGIILESPDGTRWRVTVDNSGNLSTASV